MPNVVPNITNLFNATYTNAISYRDYLRFGLAHHDLQGSTGYTVIRQTNPGFPTPYNSIMISSGTGNDTMELGSTTIRDGEVLTAQTKTANGNGALGPLFRRQAGLETFILGLREYSVSRISIYSMNAGTLSILSNTALANAFGTIQDYKLGGSGTSVSFSVGGTVTTTTVGINSAGTFGFYASQGGGANNNYCVTDGGAIITVNATTATIVINSMDAGATTSFDVGGWAESLNAGGLTVDLSIRAAADATNFTITGLTNPSGSTFTVATGRYIDMRINLTRSGVNSASPVFFPLQAWVGRGFDQNNPRVFSSAFHGGFT